MSRPASPAQKSIKWCSCFRKITQNLQLSEKSKSKFCKKNNYIKSNVFYKNI